jgi:3'(2'),5'-bisphosphate nucleotidase
MSPFIEVARELAITAGRRLMDLRLEPLVKQRKADRSLVTNADHAADQIIREGLQKYFPDHTVLTEESGLIGSARAEYIWVVDPLDGTRAYARGTPGFSVMIGLLKNGRPFAGVVMDPWEDRLYEAQKGEGSFHTCKDKREELHVSVRNEWKEMPLVTSADLPAAYALKLREELASPWVPAINSVGIKVGLVVRQVADLYFNHHPVHYWDTVAPQVVLEEAGGVFTLSDGRPMDYDLQKSGDDPYYHALAPVASNGRRHDEFVRIINDLL